MLKAPLIQHCNSEKSGEKKVHRYPHDPDSQVGLVADWWVVFYSLPLGLVDKQMLLFLLGPWEGRVVWNHFAETS